MQEASHPNDVYTVCTSKTRQLHFSCGLSCRASGGLANIPWPTARPRARSGAVRRCGYHHSSCSLSQCPAPSLRSPCDVDRHHVANSVRRVGPPERPSDCAPTRPSLQRSLEPSSLMEPADLRESQEAEQWCGGAAGRTSATRSTSASTAHSSSPLAVPTCPHVR